MRVELNFPTLSHRKIYSGVGSAQLHKRSLAFRGERSKWFDPYRSYVTVWSLERPGELLTCDWSITMTASVFSWCHARRRRADLLTVLRALCLATCQWCRVGGCCAVWGGGSALWVARSRYVMCIAVGVCALRLNRVVVACVAAIVTACVL